MLTNILLVFLGGGAGSVARFGLGTFIGRWSGAGVFPWHTLAVNILGAFAIGVLMEILALRMSMPSAERLLLVTGFLGGFTTFSAFSLENALLIERGDYLLCGAYVALSVLGCIASVFIGSGLVKAVG